MAKKGRLVVCEFAIKFTDVGLLECCDENNALYRHSAWSRSMIKAATSLLDGSRGKSLKCHNYFRKSIELQTFNKFAVNIVSINFLGLNTSSYSISILQKSWKLLRIYLIYLDFRRCISQVYREERVTPPNLPIYLVFWGCISDFFWEH